MNNKKKVKVLTELLTEAVHIAMQGDYTNGAVKDGVDQGAKNAHLALGNIVKEAHKMGITMEGDLPPFEVDPNGWVFIFRDVEDENIVALAPKDYWEEKGYIPDTSIPDDLVIPEGWYECMEHTIRFSMPLSNKNYFKEVARKHLTDLGFEEVEWEDGEKSRLRQLRDEVGDEWNPEIDDPEGLLQEERV